MREFFYGYYYKCQSETQTIALPYDDEYRPLRAEFAPHRGYRGDARRGRGQDLLFAGDHG